MSVGCGSANGAKPIEPIESLTARNASPRRRSCGSCIEATIFVGRMDSVENIAGTWRMATTTAASITAVASARRPCRSCVHRIHRNTASANGSAAECACTANQATAASTMRRDLVSVSPQDRMSPVPILANTTASTGFQITEDSARSNGDDAMMRTVAIAKVHDPVARRMPRHNTTSAIDCSAARPRPPACGRLPAKGPMTTRMSHNTQ